MNARSISPTAACADQAGTAGSSTVSTEDPRKTLKRMRLHHMVLISERDAHERMYKAADLAAEDLEEAIKRLEREVEG